MGVQENEDESVNLLEVQHAKKEQRKNLLSRFFTKSLAEDEKTKELSVESEDEERFGETGNLKKR